jgi:hypothetical protein
MKQERKERQQGEGGKENVECRKGHYRRPLYGLGQRKPNPDCPQKEAPSVPSGCR